MLAYVKTHRMDPVYRKALARREGKRKERVGRDGKREGRRQRGKRERLLGLM